MDKTTTQRALAAGARAETDFTLFANLLNLRQQLKKQLNEMMKVPTGVPPPRGILLRYDFFLQRGRFFEAQPLPRGYRRRKAQECYCNSSRLAMSRGELTYCEGFVALPLPNSYAAIDHGWCVTAEGKVVDVTLRPPRLAYFGVTFALAELAEADSLPLIDTIIERRLQDTLGLPEGESP